MIVDDGKVTSLNIENARPGDRVGAAKLLEQL